jgi:hypothetical protein
MSSAERRVDRLGSSLIAVRPASREPAASADGGAVNVNLYADLHFRSLTVIGTGDLTTPS